MASEHDPNDPQKAFEELLRQFGLQPGADGSIDLGRLMSQMQGAMGRMGSPVDDKGLNWAFVKDIARKVTAMQGPDPSVTAAQIAEIKDAARLADLWLDTHTTFEALDAPASAWSRAEWIEGTSEVWQRLASPIGTSFAAAITSMMDTDAPEFAGLSGFMQPLMKQAATGMMASQIGQALGVMSTDVVSACSMSLPVTTRPIVALLPTNVAAFSDGLEQSDADVRLYLTLRESARQRLFASVGWLAPQMLAQIEKYARGITMDRSAIESAIQEQMSQGFEGMDINELNKLGETLSGKLFEPAKTPEQVEILERLEVLVALIEGWVDDVVAQTTKGLMPSAPALLEAVRRRRVGGQTEASLKSLLNLELRPRKVREAATLWAAVRSSQGIAGRDEVWSHPDKLPRVADLADPLGFVERLDPTQAQPEVPAMDEMDAALAKLLDEESRGDQEG